MANLRWGTSGHTPQQDIARLVFDAASVRRVEANLRKAGGTADYVRGTLLEGQHYATYVEHGTIRMRPRPHMLPAFQEMLRECIPIMRAEMSRKFDARFDYDAMCADAVAAAMYTMEGKRQAHLERLVYSQPESPSYQRTGFLRNNRTITVEVQGRPDLSSEDAHSG